MADIKISELTAALTVGDSDVIPMTASGSTVKASASLLKAYNIGTDDISGVGDGSVTGAISSLDSDKAIKDDLASIRITGSTNNTGNTIDKGTYFYKDGTLVKAKVEILNNATLTLNTNYVAVTAGGLNELGLVKSYKDTATGARFYRVGNVCQLNLEATSSSFTANADDKIINIPSDFLPLYGTNISFKDVLNNKRLFARNDVNGTGIYTNDSLANIALRGSYTYIAEPLV